MINNNFNHINNGIVGIFVISKIDINNKLINNRQIRRDIIEYYRKISCVICGSNTDLVCDHKNDLYNDMRVLNTKTQRLDDFQSLCNHCNLQKRQICKNEIINKQIYIIIIQSKIILNYLHYIITYNIFIFFLIHLI